MSNSNQTPVPSVTSQQGELSKEEEEKIRNAADQMNQAVSTEIKDIKVEAAKIQTPDEKTDLLKRIAALEKCMSEADQEIDKRIKAYWDKLIAERKAKLQSLKQQVAQVMPIVDSNASLPTQTVPDQEALAKKKDKKHWIDDALGFDFLG
jgi:hypothetical protein